VCVSCVRVECVLLLNGYLYCVGPRCIFGPVHSGVCVCRVECVLLLSGQLHHVRAPLRILLSFFRSVGVSRGSMGVLFFKRV